MKEKRIGFPHLGEYDTVIGRALERTLQDESINRISFFSPPPTTKATILRGWQKMDENMCLPAKITLGNILDNIEENKITGYLMWDSCGDCRYKVYHILHKRILNKLGYSIHMYPLRAGHLLRDLKAIDPVISTATAFKMLRNSLLKIWEVDKPLLEKQNQPPKDRPKVGIVGEIYTILEPNANLNILEKFEERKMFVHNSLPLSEFVFKRGFHNSWLRKLGIKRPDINYTIREEAAKETEEYLPRYSIGGHGKESIINTLYYAKMGYDAVIHIQPFPCMPESTVSEFLDQISQAYGIPLNHFTFDQQFGETNLDTRVEAMANMLTMRKKLGKSELVRSKGIRSSYRKRLWLGIDVGSVSTKGVFLDQEKKVKGTFYIPTSRDPIEALTQGLEEIKEKVEFDFSHIQKVVSTGSGRRLTKVVLGADIMIDEITAQTLASLHYKPEVRTIIEIGGQDSKFIQIDKEGIPVWFNLNSICSAGTGSFLMGAAREFGLSIQEFAKIAHESEQEVKITGRCGVFAESDLVSKQQQGYNKHSLIRGMCMALPQNYLNNVARNRSLKSPIVFTGGVASNQGVVEGFEKHLGKKVEVLPYNKISGAVGACLYAQLTTSGGQSSFVGFNLKDYDFTRAGFSCKDCANQCQISVIFRNGKVLAVFGSKCRKWDTSSQQVLEHKLNIASGEQAGQHIAKS